jgi:poly-gamma-glutamate capsule biosynthesis protein CapA/YwtB (metallophosphatase superfamily)
LKFAFRSPPAYAQLFAEVGIDVLKISNNHRMDFGAVQFTDTIKKEAKGIKILGHKN